MLAVARPPERGRTARAGPPDGGGGKPAARCRAPRGGRFCHAGKGRLRNRRAVRHGPVAPAGGRGAHGLRGAPSAGGGGRARGGGGHSVGAERRDGAGHGRGGPRVRDGHLPPAQAGSVSGTGAGLRRGDHRGGHRPRRAGGRGAGRRGRHAHTGKMRSPAASACAHRAQGQLWPRSALGREPGHGGSRGHRRDGGPARGRGAGNGGLPGRCGGRGADALPLRHLCPAVHTG